MPIVIDPTLAEPSPPTTATGPDGILTVTLDEGFAGALLVVDFSATVGVTYVEFNRVGQDGTEVHVRSGDPARAAGGVAVAYDDEAPLGVGVSWYAIALNDDGDELAVSDAVVLLLPDPDFQTWPRDLWVKALDDVSLSMLVQVEDWAELGYDGQVPIGAVIGGSKPQATKTGPMLGSTSSLVIITESAEALLQFKQLLNETLLLLQTCADYHRPDQYVAVTGYTETQLAKIWDPGRRWTLTLTEIERPDTFGQGLRIPGRTYDDRLANYPTYDSVPVREYIEALTG